MSTVKPELRLVLPNRADNVALVRQALGGVVEVLELGRARMLDINAAVSEACNNVVVHAYQGDQGPMDVRLCIQPDELEVVVRDRGVGIRPNLPEPDREVQGLGLSLIQSLTDRVEFAGGVDDGTKVTMGFSFDGAAPAALPDRGDEPVVEGPSGELSISVPPGPLAAPVLGRLIAMLAARADFTLEGISEAELITDTLAAHAPKATLGNTIQMGVDQRDGNLVLRIGPLEKGGAAHVIEASALGDLPPVLERLTGERRVEDSPDGEILCLVLERDSPA